VLGGTTGVYAGGRSAALIFRFRTGLGFEDQNTPRRDGHFLAGRRVATDALALSTHGKQAEA
jgi:hypothetical protein